MIPRPAIAAAFCICLGMPALAADTALPACPNGLICISPADAAQIVMEMNRRAEIIEKLGELLREAKIKSGCV